LDKNKVTGKSASETQKVFFRITDEYDFGKEKLAVRIAGYGGYPSESPSVYSRISTLQYAQGLIDKDGDTSLSKYNTSNVLEHKISVCHGNEGSPIYLMESNAVVAIQSCAGIDKTTEKYNFGCGMKNNNIDQVIQAMLDVDILIDSDHPSKKETGSILSPFKSLHTALQIPLPSPKMVKWSRNTT
jgi:hypothetical protein